jgi:hypothetical protein
MKTFYNKNNKMLRKEMKNTLEDGKTSVFMDC